MSVIIGKIVSIFLITGVGYIANKVKVLPNESNKYLVDLMMKITCPCMVITAIMSTELTSDTLSKTIQMLLLAAGFFILSTLIGWIFCVKILGIKPENDAGIYIACMATVNNGFMGFPITLALFGNDVLFLMVLFQTMLVIYLYSVGVVLVNYGREKLDSTGSYSILKSLANPCTICAVVSIVLLLLRVELPEVLYNSLDSLGSATVPISMLVVGIQLGGSSFKKVLTNKNLLITSFAKMLVFPLLTFLAVNWTPLATDLKIALTFGAAFPTAVVMVAIASMEKRNSTLAAEMVAFTTLISIITLPAAAILLMTYYGMI